MPIGDPSVVRLIVEGGGVEVFGRKEPDGSWSFITSSAQLDIDDDGNDSVIAGGMPRCTDLAHALPSNWIICFPVRIHPELRDWFRCRYEAAVASLPAPRRVWHAQDRDRLWQELFASTPPDRWSGDEEF